MDKPDLLNGIHEDAVPVSRVANLIIAALHVKLNGDVFKINAVPMENVPSLAHLGNLQRTAGCRDEQAEQHG
jgi:hypothetical protein